MAVLVAGVGYIGAALAASLLQAGERVVALDNGFATDLSSVARLTHLGEFHLIEGSVTSGRDVERAFACGPFTAVYHLAAQASAYHPPALTRYTEATNLTGPRRVFAAAARHGVPRIVYASSLRVYGPELPPLLDETAPYGPQRDLSHLSHIYGEKLLEMHARAAGFTGVAVRLAVVYGVGPVMKTDYRYLTVPNKFCLQAVRGEALQVYAGADTPTAFVHLTDAGSALRAAATAPWPPGFHAANAAGEVCPVPAVAAAVAGVARARGLEVQVSVAEAPAPASRALDPTAPHGPGNGSLLGPTGSGQSGRRAVAATSARPEVRIASRLHAVGWRPTRTLADSLGAVLDFYAARGGV